MRRLRRAIDRGVARTGGERPGERRLTAWGPGESAVDTLYLLPHHPRQPSEIFEMLRWGGRAILLDRDERNLRELCRSFGRGSGFDLEIGPRVCRIGPLGGRVPLCRERWHYLVVRRTAILPPGQTSDRFTFHVELARMPSHDDYLVVKKVPSYGSVMVRLKQRFPNTPHENLAKRARKLVDKVFPVFLTREVAFLRLLQRDLPEAYRGRVPEVLDAQRGADGLVRQVRMNWLRLGSEPIGQLAFARQAADLVRVLHDVIHLVHLDLRLDNFVLTDAGVCLVDFGSAVRMDEDLSRSPMLNTLFSEMMSTSQIQKLLGRMKDTGEVTSSVLVEGHQKVDKAADLFNLAVQIAKPHKNPDLRPLIQYDPDSEVARRIADLSERILKPIEPQRPRHRSAADILADLDQIAESLDR